MIANDGDVGVRETSNSTEASDLSAVSEDVRTWASGNILTRLEAVIETERRNLSKAEAVLGCLAIAMEERPDQDENSPYYPDVAEVVLDMVRHSVNQLDSTNLARVMAE